MKKLIFFSLLFVSFFMVGCDLLWPPEDPQFTVEAVSSPYGTISPSKVTVPMGTDVICYIIPKEGYILKGLKIDGKDVTVTDKYIFLNVSSNHKIEAIYEKYIKKSYTITGIAGTHGTITPSSVVVEEGGNATFNIKADPGYVIDYLLDDGNKLPPIDVYTVRDASRDDSFEVAFKEDSIPWHLLKIEWKLKVTYIDQYQRDEPNGEVLNYFPDGTYTRYRDGVLYNENWKLDRKSTPATITYGGRVCKIEVLNDEQFLISYINGYNQTVKLLYFNNKYKD